MLDNVFIKCSINIVYVCCLIIFISLHPSSSLWEKDIKSLFLDLGLIVFITKVTIVNHVYFYKNFLTNIFIMSS